MVSFPLGRRRNDPVWRAEMTQNEITAYLRLVAERLGGIEEWMRSADYSRKEIKDDLHNLREDVSDRLKDIEKWRHEADVSDARRAWIDRVVSGAIGAALVSGYWWVPALARGFVPGP